jgi:hypothetical protein
LVAERTTLSSSLDDIWGRRLAGMKTVMETTLFAGESKFQPRHVDLPIKGCFSDYISRVDVA